MKITSIRAENFLSFRKLEFEEIDHGLTVVVGPNGAGKSNLTRLLEMIGIALTWADGGVHVDFGRFRDARSIDAPGDALMVARIGIELDHPSERALMLDFIQSFAVSGLLDHPSPAHGQLGLAALQDWLDKWVTAQVITPLLAGEIVVTFGGMPGAEEWSAGYEFSFAEARYSWSFRGPLNDTVGRGPIVGGQSVGGWGALHNRLLDPSPSAFEPLLPFRFEYLLGDDKQSRIAGRTEPLTPQRLLAPIAALADRLEIPIPHGNSIGFAAVMRKLYRDALVIVPGQRPAPTRYFAAAAVGRTRESDDLSSLPLELYALQSGDNAARGRYRRIQERFRSLTGRDFAMQAGPSQRQSSGRPEEWEIEPRIIEHGREFPLDFAGAGIWESLVLSHATTLGDEAIVVLDEPAQNLHPTLQKRVLTTLLERPGQTLVVTHSPYLVPARNRQDLHRPIRIRKEEGWSSLQRLAPPGESAVTREQEGQLWQLFAASTDARGLLFAEGVVLCEGGTEVGILEQWLSDTPGDDGPAERNVAFYDVGGHERFGFYTRYLDGFAIPWAIVCDTKIMNPVKTNSIYRQLGLSVPNVRIPKGVARSGYVPSSQSLRRLKTNLEKHGVFTLVTKPQAEIETFLEPLDPKAWRAAHRSEGGNKVRRGRVFAVNVDRPAEVNKLWRKIVDHLEGTP